MRIVSRSFALLSALGLFASLSACGGKSAGPSVAPEIEVRSGALQTGSLPAARMIAARSAVELLGASSAGQVLAVVGGQLFAVADDRLELRALYRQDGDPASMGRARSIAARAAGGAWVAADAGVFVLDALYVSRDRLMTGTGAVQDLAEATAGPLKGLWLATEDGLFRRQGDALERDVVPTLAASAAGVAIEQNGNAALVLAGGEIALLEPSGSAIVIDRPPLDAGKIHAVRGGVGALYAASDGGLLRWRAGRAPRWVRFTLSPQGSPPQKVLAVAVDHATGNVWARIERGLVRLSGDALMLFELSIDGGDAKALAVDQLGDVWVAGAQNLVHLTTGSAPDAVTFRANLKPWISAHCSECHRNQTLDFENYAVFSERAENALARVRSGDMPRCSGGLPCPPAQRLKQEEYSLLEQWIRNGKPE